MTRRPVLQPNTAHPITVEPTGQRVKVRVGSTVIADTGDALTLSEARYPAVYYIPMRDVAQDVLRPSEKTSYCPYKGDATYFHIVTADGARVEDAVWTYQRPYPALADIADHVAFYPEKTQITVAQ